MTHPRAPSLTWPLSLWLLCGATFLSSAAEPDSAAPNRSIVLDTAGAWRMYHVLKPPVIQFADGVRPVLVGQRWLNWETPTPSPTWRDPGFDDSQWLRGPAAAGCRSPYLARLCLRGKFEVVNPANVDELSVSVGYCGGAIVYVNGQEIGRSHLSSNASEWADGYPEVAFATAKGGLLGLRSGYDAETQRRLQLRTRTLEDLSVPRRLLRAGVNVLAIEIVRAPYHQVVDEKKEGDVRRRGCLYELALDTCQLNRVQLSAARAEGLVPNAVRPAGSQAWNSDLLAADFDLDHGGRCEPTRPLHIVGARNGCFSGKVVIGSDGDLVGLRAAVGDLAGDAGIIPASAIRVRYAVPWGDQPVVYPYSCEVSPYPEETTFLGALLESPLETFPVREKRSNRYSLKTPGQPATVFGAVVPVWVTVNVPLDAKAGEYAGQLRISVGDEQAAEVPIELEVLDWAVPDPQDYRTWVELFQSPDTLAVEYGVELWSDRHFELIAKSMAFLHEVGSRVLYVPLICRTNLGNEQSMVRWIPKGNDQYEYDFTVMEEYLDLAEKHMGRPKIVALNVWDIYVGAKQKLDTSERAGEVRALEHLSDRGIALGEGPVVTAFDPATQEARDLELPPYTAPQSKAAWGPLFTELQKRLARRGLSDTMMLGIMTDAWPSKEEVQFFKEIAPDLPWVSHSHHGVHGQGPSKIYGLAESGYQTRVWHVAFDDDPTNGRMYGWKQPELIAYYVRARNFNSFPLTTWRHLAEFSITGAQRGIGRLGADFWQAIRDKRGRRVGTVSMRYPQSSWRNLDLYSSLLAPGPEGPVATTRLELYREGVQECEARIAIESALADDGLKGKLGDDLANRCQETLDERIKFMWKGGSTLRLTGVPSHYATASSTWRGTPGLAGHIWFVGSGWQQRTRELYSLAGEVAELLSTEK